MKKLSFALTYLFIVTMLSIAAVAILDQNGASKWWEILVGVIWIGFPIAGPCGWFGVFSWLYNKLIADRIYMKAANRGFNNGYDVGFSSGYDQGYSDAKNNLPYHEDEKAIS